MNNSSRIYVAGHRGLVGSALVRRLQAEGFNNLITRTSKELDLKRQADVEAFFHEHRPEYVFLAAAKVGGILANDTYRADFMYDNLMIQSNVIQASYAFGVKKLFFLGSSCIYPKNCPQPIKEEYLLTGPLEPTNEAYAVAKIAGLIMCNSYNRQYGTRFIAAMPTNLYGPNDNFDLETAHVLPALLRKFHDAKQADAPAVTVWGTGSAFREFIHVDDVAAASCFLMKHYEGHDIVNIGSGEEISIRDLAFLIRDIVSYRGNVVFDRGKPDGTPRKLTDVTRLNSLGWRHTIPLREGIEKTYAWYCGERAGVA